MVDPALTIGPATQFAADILQNMHHAAPAPLQAGSGCRSPTNALTVLSEVSNQQVPRAAHVKVKHTGSIAHRDSNKSTGLVPDSEDDNFAIPAQSHVARDKSAVRAARSRRQSKAQLTPDPSAAAAPTAQVSKARQWRQTSEAAAAADPPSRLSANASAPLLGGRTADRVCQSTTGRCDMDTPPLHSAGKGRLSAAAALGGLPKTGNKRRPSAGRRLSAMTLLQPNLGITVGHASEHKIQQHGADGHPAAAASVQDPPQASPQPQLSGVFAFNALPAEADTPTFNASKQDPAPTTVQHADATAAEGKQAPHKVRQQQQHLSHVAGPGAGSAAVVIDADGQVAADGSVAQGALDDSSRQGRDNLSTTGILNAAFDLVRPAPTAAEQTAAGHSAAVAAAPSSLAPWSVRRSKPLTPSPASACLQDDTAAMYPPAACPTFVPDAEAQAVSRHMAAHQLTPNTRKRAQAAMDTVPQSPAQNPPGLAEWLNQGQQGPVPGSSHR